MRVWTAVAATSAGIQETITPDSDAVARSTEEATRIGVSAAPAVFRHGPVLHVDVNPAAYPGDTLGVLRLIDRVSQGRWDAGGSANLRASDLADRFEER